MELRGGAPGTGLARQLSPGLAVVGAGHKANPSGGKVVVGLHAGVHLNAIDFGWVIAALEFYLRPAASSIDVGQRKRVVIDQPLALIARQRALTGGGGHPT